MLGEMPSELSRLWTTLGAAIDRMTRDLVSEASRLAGGRRRIGRTPTRRPSPHVGRPMSHPLRLPRPLRARTPATALDRQRERERREGRGSPLAAAVEAGADRVAATVREGLLDLQRRLRGLQQRFGNNAGRGR